MTRFDQVKKNITIVGHTGSLGSRLYEMINNVRFSEMEAVGINTETTEMERYEILKQTKILILAISWKDYFKFLSANKSALSGNTELIIITCANPLDEKNKWQYHSQMLHNTESKETSFHYVEKLASNFGIDCRVMSVFKNLTPQILDKKLVIETRGNKFLRTFVAGNGILNTMYIKPMLDEIGIESIYMGDKDTDILIQESVVMQLDAMASIKL